MDLSDYLTRHKETAKDFAERAGLTQQAVDRYLNGKRTPKPDAMAKIYTATGGAVTANDFHGHEPVPAAPAVPAQTEAAE